VDRDPGHSAGATHLAHDEAELTNREDQEPAMTTTTLEQIPTTWIDSRDIPFFTIVAHLVTDDFVFGAGVLLECNGEQEISTSARLVSSAR
jgi:hypothetical protein